MENIRKRRIFISFSNKSSQNNEWVKILAFKLVELGFDVHIEFFDFNTDVDFIQYLKNELLLADKIILICDKYYMQEMDLQSSRNFLESNIILNDIKDNENKYIYIFRGRNINTTFSIFLKSKYTFICGEEISEDEIQELLYLLLPYFQEPDLCSNICNNIPQILLDFVDNSTIGFSELWCHIYPYLDCVGTIFGVVGGTVGFGKWLKSKFEHKQSPCELLSFVTDSNTWSSLELASDLNITQEEAKNILKGFGYEWNKSEKLYYRTDRTYAIINLLEESLKNK